ncbi:MAG: CDP-glucose 4,6-dehydratase [Clostridia bacterium]|nr:CDP-glucose 4,6-dehydratase [Clostridia bacterium]
MNLDFYHGKRVLVTGHTGFKGTWLTKILVDAGAQVAGISLNGEDRPFYERAGLTQLIHDVRADIRDYSTLLTQFRLCKPEIVFHLAAQPLVRQSYACPRGTYETNVMGTLNVLECIRLTDSVKSAVIVTTDKVYRNREQGHAFREDDILDGFDPYSNSKSCAELATAAYRRSFPGLPPISTARAGNVIGGGDFAKDRIIPDCVRAASKGEPIHVRNPHSVRPYQHVLEPLFAYLLIAEKQCDNPALADCYNIGPEDCDCVTTGELVTLFCDKWGEGASWIDQGEPNAPHEAGLLKLDCISMKETFGWRPRWNIDAAIAQTVLFSRVWMNDGDIPKEMDREIHAYI